MTAAVAQTGAERWVAAVLAVSAGAVALTFWLNDGYPAAMIPWLRSLAGVLIVTSQVIAWRRRVLLLSPLLWMGTLFGAAFVLCPLALQYVETRWPLWDTFDLRWLPRADAYLGSLAEGYMLQAAALMLTVFAVATAFSRTVMVPTPRLRVVPTAAVGVVAAALHLANRAPADLVVPVTMLSLAILAFGAADRSKGALWGMNVVLAVAIAGAAANFEMKFLVIFLIVPAIAFVIVRRFSLAFFGWAGAAVLMVVCAPIVLFYHAAPGLEADAQRMEVLVRGKILVRQTETAHCLDTVVDKHWQNGQSGTLLPLAAALVPRVIWPEKPQISDGTFYAETYCGHFFDPGVPRAHSSSLTVLGEPVREAGRLGGLEGTVVIALLGLAVWSLAAVPGVGPAMALALLPWVVDIDQNFSMFLARAVKAALVMGMTGALIVGVHRVRRQF